MATVAAKRVDNGNGGVTISWGALDQSKGDVGEGVFIGDLVDVSVQAKGTGATTVSIQGSNDGVNYAPLGAGMTLTMSNGVAPVTNIVARALYIRPSTPSGNADTIVTVGGYRRGT